MKRKGNDNAKDSASKHICCAVYTRKSTSEGLDQAFNSLDAQREACAAYIASQKNEGWVAVDERYDDGGYTGGNTDRPALQRLLTGIESGGINCVVVYKVDRLSRSLMDFARMMETFEKHSVSFVSVTQAFNTTHSMGRLTLNILLSFAQFEREIISERTRDKIAAARRKGKWGGGHSVLGYDAIRTTGASKLVVNPDEAEHVRQIFDLYLEHQSLVQTAAELNVRGWTTKNWTTGKGTARGGKLFDKAILYRLLGNVTYRGMVRYKNEVYQGEHEAIVDEVTFERVQAMLRSNGLTGGAQIRNRYGALLKGLLICKPCNSTMAHSFTNKGNRQYRYYVCTNAQRRGWKQCPSKSIPAEQIEQFVVDQIRAIGMDPTVMALTLEQARSQALEESAALESDMTVAEREIHGLNSEISEAASDTASNGHVATRLADLHEELHKAEQHLTKLRRQLEANQSNVITKNEVDSALKAFAPLWESLSPRERARVLRLLVQRVEYDGANGKIAVTFHANGIRTLGQHDLSDDQEVELCQTA